MAQSSNRRKGGQPTEVKSPIDWESAVELATGPATIGPWRMNESKFHYVDDPAVSMRPDGTVGIAWVDNQKQTIFFQTYDADGKSELSQPVAVSDSPEIFSWLPRVRYGDNGKWYVLWQEIVFSGGSHGGEAFFCTVNRWRKNIW